MSCSKFHSAIFFTALLYIRVISFHFQSHIFVFSYSNERLHRSMFLYSVQDSSYQLGTNRSHCNHSPEIMVLHDLRHLLFMFHLVGFHTLRY